jgi:hypothetical protein
MPSTKHGHDEHCAELHRALDHAKALMRSAPIQDTMAGDPHSAVAELRLEREAPLTAEIARIEQALREHGCSVSDPPLVRDAYAGTVTARQPDEGLDRILT